MASSEAPKADTNLVELVELDDVPAAVVCAHCGAADCLGECVELEETTHASKVVAIVPWERPGGWLSRLWSTARLTTVNYRAFFGSLPAGDPSAAGMFALIAELVTVSAHLALVVGILAVVAPDLVGSVLHDPMLFAYAVRAVFVAVPSVALMMVFLHVLHGLALDWAAARFGGRKRLGLRFGLYACGWDLATLPLGLVVLALSAGPLVALRTAPLGVTLPPKAAHAYLVGVQHLDHHAAVAAGRMASTLAGIAALACSTAVVVAIAVVVAL